MPFMKRRDDTWIQPHARVVPVEMSPNGLLSILEIATSPSTHHYSDFDLSSWCEHYSTILVVRQSNLTKNEQVALNVADDIHGTWMIHIFKQYPANAIASVDLNSIALPQSRWQEWKQTLKNELNDG